MQKEEQRVSAARRVIITLRAHHDKSTAYYQAGWDDLFLITTMVLVMIVLRRIGHALLHRFAAFCGIKESSNKQKFKEAGWFAIAYTVSIVLDLYVLRMDVPEWVGWESHIFWQNVNDPITFRMKMYNIIELGIWYHFLVVVAVLEEPRRDYFAMVAHHLSTVALVHASFMTGYTKYGLAIMFLCDPADLFLFHAKCIKYISEERKSKLLGTITDGLFAVFVVLWIVPRNVLLPRLMLAWTLENPVENPHFDERPWWIFYYTNAFFVLIQILMTYWLVQILGVLYRLFVHGEVDDPREKEMEGQEQAVSGKDETEEPEEDEPVVVPTRRRHESARLRKQA